MTDSNEPRGAYEEGTPKYATAGWDGIIPVRVGKTKAPAISDVTGYTGRQMTPEESLELSKKQSFAFRNIGLRMPKGVVGVDVDHYGDKRGGDTLASLEEELGVLPRTFYSSARGPGVSGIRLFRVPEDLEFENVFGADIECIQFKHRFMTAPPSKHHTGNPYQWYTSDNVPMQEYPRPEDIPVLPQSWVDRFGHEPKQRSARVGSFDGLEEFFESHSTGDLFRYLEASKRIFSTAQGSRHDSMLKALGCAMRDAAAGMYPARDAVDQLQELWVEATDGEDRFEEFGDLVERAATDAATEEPSLYRKGLVNPGSPVAFLEEEEGSVSDVLLFESDDPEAVLFVTEYAPKGTTVMWVKDLAKIDDYSSLSGVRVYIFPDDDPAKNLDVYERVDDVASELDMLNSVAVYPKMPHRVIPLIQSLTDDGDRRDKFRIAIAPDRLLEKPAKAKPRGNQTKKKKDSEDIEARNESTLSDIENRTLVELTGDRKHDNDNTVFGVKKRWDGKKVFNYGNTISRVRNDEIIPQDKSMWMNTLVEACKFIKRNSKGVVINEEPPGYVVSATLSRHEDFTPLEGIKHSPFVRSDGTVCQDPGYDEYSKMKLYLADNLKGISVPDNPTKEEVVAAREFVQEWLYDFRQIMPSRADEANTLAMVLTPFIRGSVPVVPLCVVNGLQHGVGKNKLANGIAILYTGKALIPKTFSTDDEEQRKQIMSIFREGGDFVCYDEAHLIDGKALAQALTTTTWSDRLLGVSHLAEYPNNASWISLGNQVRVEGDCVRRVYQVRLQPTRPNPENRSASDFRYPNFEDRTAEIRKELLEAVLTMIRGWYAAGSPRPSVEPSFGSFETWENLIRGVLEYSGVEGFLESQQEFRAATSANNEYWVQHFEWLDEKFRDRPFTCSEVHEALVNDGPKGEPPPRMEDLQVKGYARVLGKAYDRMKGRFLGGYQLVKVSEHRNRANLWSIRKVS